MIQIVMRNAYQLVVKGGRTTFFMIQRAFNLDQIRHARENLNLSQTSLLVATSSIELSCIATVIDIYLINPNTLMHLSIKELDPASFLYFCSTASPYSIDSFDLDCEFNMYAVVNDLWSYHSKMYIENHLEYHALEELKSN